MKGLEEPSEDHLLGNHTLHRKEKDKLMNFCLLRWVFGLLVPQILVIFFLMLVSDSLKKLNSSDVSDQHFISAYKVRSRMGSRWINCNEVTLLWKFRPFSRCRMERLTFSFIFAFKLKLKKRLSFTSTIFFKMDRKRSAFHRRHFVSKVFEVTLLYSYFLCRVYFYLGFSTLESGTMSSVIYYQNSDF